MANFLKKLFGSSNEAEIKRLRKILDKVNALEPKMHALRDEELRALTPAFKDRLQKGETLDDLLPEAFAAVREAAVRAIGQRPFDVQVLGGIVLHQGRIAEMKTGEGKTVTCVMPAYLNALTGKGVHIVTVNDYLAKYQGEWMSKIYRFLGMSVGLILSGMSNAQRRASYACDIVYGTNNEFGFDYLRDNMVVRLSDVVQRELNYCIVDEVDSILIDEARTPLIISGQGDKATDLYARANAFVLGLRPGKVETDEFGNETQTGDYVKDEKDKTVNLTAEGVTKAERFFNVENLSDLENTDINHHIQVALKAHALMHRDIDYVVKDGEVLIVDEFTGRLMVGRRYSDGLHQAIEAKEGVEVARESRTLATITFQNYFRMYHKLSGMTGTAKTEEDEFKSIYSLDVVEIPTNRPMIRVDENDLVYRTQQAKFKAVVADIQKTHATGQPVLVGTVSVEKSEMLSGMLDRVGIPHTVLNAKHHQREAEIVAQAGKVGAVTIATNMAGRGTDILLGGNPEFLARRELLRQGMSEELVEEARGYSDDAPEEVVEARKAYRDLVAQFKKTTDVEHDKVVSLGGLYIIGTERHESRRIDNQLRGRAGRQGDPGRSRFYIALDDDLMRLFGGDRIAPMIEKLGLDDEAIEYGPLSKQIESAQKRVEGRNFDIRRHVLQYDDVMNAQREVIYGQRREVLSGADVRDQIQKMVDEQIELGIGEHCSEHSIPEEWDLKGLGEYLNELFTYPAGAFENLSEDQYMDMTVQKITERLKKEIWDAYMGLVHKAEEAQVDMGEVERVVLLRVVDQKWMDHIDDMDQLRQGIGLRAYGQKDPVVAYKIEGYNMFEEMVANIHHDVVRTLYHARINKVPAQREAPRAVETTASHAAPAAAHEGGSGAAAGAPNQPPRQMPVHAPKKIGRNDPCPCGSGKKYKNCCGKNA